jgi:cellulose synthase/poly-beta-1,6-N-acetylglucosamine synthase-like glycosyltransferase
MQQRTEHLEFIRGISARGGLNELQKGVIVLTVLSLGVSLLLDPLMTISWIVQIMIMAYGLIVFYKTYVFLNSGKGTAIISQLLPAPQYRSYDVLVPCYKEAKVIHQIITNLQSLEYPRHRLNIWLLLEEDDWETRNAVARLSLPYYIHNVVVPRSYLPGVKGKPRAMNYVCKELGLVKGAYLVIYDAEDIPDTDQLKKAATAFSLYPDITCFQAELRWWNANLTRKEWGTWKWPLKMFFTKMMAASYALHSSIYLPGLCKTGSVVPLGGTSNHFRVSVLRELGWWDPYNVTEDLDLGVKLFRTGHKVMALPSITYEEATETFRTQKNQLSRWTKGHTVTALAHTRNPIRLLQDLRGPKGVLSFVSSVAVSHPASLAAPLFWGMSLVYVRPGAQLIERITPFTAFYVGLICTLANVLFIVAAMYAVIRTKQYGLWPWMLLLPLHWATVGVWAACKAAKELVKGEWYFWDKTPRTRVIIEAPQPSPAPSPSWNVTGNLSLSESE